MTEKEYLISTNNIMESSDKKLQKANESLLNERVRKRFDKTGEHELQMAGLEKFCYEPYMNNGSYDDICNTECQADVWTDVKFKHSSYDFVQGKIVDSAVSEFIPNKHGLFLVIFSWDFRCHYGISHVDYTPDEVQYAIFINNSDPDTPYDNLYKGKYQNIRQYVEIGGSKYFTKNVEAGFTLFIAKRVWLERGHKLKIKVKPTVYPIEQISHSEGYLDIIHLSSDDRYKDTDNPFNSYLFQ